MKTRPPRRRAAQSEPARSGGGHAPAQDDDAAGQETPAELEALRAWVAERLIRLARQFPDYGLVLVNRRLTPSEAERELGPCVLVAQSGR